jgi:hypothetical protein
MTEVSQRDFIKKINQLTRQSPFYYRFNECRYSHVKGYIDHDDVMFSMARSLTSYQCYNTDLFETDFTHRTSLIILDRAYQKGFGSYWLSEPLFDAFCNSQLPKTVRQIKQVIPCGVLLFPPKIKNPDGQLLKWICFYHRLADQTIAPIQIGDSRLEIEVAAEDTLSWVTLFDDGTQYGVHRHLKVDETHQLNYQDEDEIFINQDLASKGFNTAMETEKEFTDKVTDLLVQTLLYLQQKSDFLASPSRSLSKRGSSKKQKLTPYIIGRDYRVKSESNLDASTAGQYRTHWRRGFYRWQPYGSRELTEYKLIWIEPILVNG